MYKIKQINLSTYRISYSDKGNQPHNMHINML